MPITLMNLFNLCLVVVASESQPGIRQPRIRQGPRIWAMTIQKGVFLIFHILVLHKRVNHFDEIYSTVLFHLLIFLLSSISPFFLLIFR